MYYLHGIAIANLRLYGAVTVISLLGNGLT